MSGIAGNHPLRGLNDDDIGPRFPAVSDAYDGELQEIVVKSAKELGIEVCGIKYSKFIAYIFCSLQMDLVCTTT
jgi:purine nucleoside phosphorylase